MPTETAVATGPSWPSIGITILLAGGLISAVLGWSMILQAGPREMTREECDQHKADQPPGVTVIHCPLVPTEEPTAALPMALLGVVSACAGLILALIRMVTRHPEWFSNK